MQDLTLNKLANEIIKSFYQTNNDFKECTTESIEAFLEALADKDFLVKQGEFENTNFVKNRYIAFVNYEILIYLDNTKKMDAKREKSLFKKFEKERVKLAILLKFGKQASVSRKSYR